MQEALLICIIGIFCGFYVQTVVGFAGALVALPILLLGMELPDAISMISLFYLISSAVLLYQNWSDVNKKIVIQLALTITVGTILGILVLKLGKPILLKKSLGIFVILYVIYKMTDKDKVAFLSKLGTPLGLLGGFFSGLFSTGGPIYMIYVQSKLKTSDAIRATMIGVIAFTNLVRVPTLTVNGLLGVAHLKLALYIIPFYFLAQFLGNVTYDKLNEKTFHKLLLILLFLSGISLIVR